MAESPSPTRNPPRPSGRRITITLEDDILDGLAAVDRMLPIRTSIATRMRLLMRRGLPIVLAQNGGA